MRDGDHKILATLLPQQNPGDFADARQPKDWSVMEFIKKAELGRFELFNLADDPGHAERLANFRAEMEAWQRETRDPWLYRDGVDGDGRLGPQGSPHPSWFLHGVFG